MDSNLQSNDTTLMDEGPQRPESLKILGILSFVGCGLMILIYALGTTMLSFDEAMIESFWAQMLESNPQLETLDPVTFFHNVGMVCVYGLIATIFSLIGVIMMWRLEKIGFFVYAIAELSTNFFSLDMGTPEQHSYGGMIFGIILDLVFITLYFVNLKHMNKKNNNSFVQTGG